MNDISKLEDISALTDGEMSEAAISAFLAQMNSPQEKQTWDIYHQIGDVLRSDDLAVPVSADFAKKFSARFASEPVILLPETHRKNKQSEGFPYLRTYMGMASATAAAIFALLVIPPLLHQKDQSATSVQVAQNAQSRGAAAPIQLASAPVLVNESPQQVVSNDAEAVVAGKAVNEKPDVRVEMLRDPRIDSYLLAHQRFSPSIGSTQYVTRANAVSGTPEK